jgi:hypothetical protein
MIANNNVDDLRARLAVLARKRTIPFCYGCYQEAPTGCCASCGDDDLMRLLPGVGCEWGIDWVAKHLVDENVLALDTDQAFEEFVHDCHPETVQVGWLTLDTVDTMKKMDPIAWDLAKDEWVDDELSEGVLLTFDNGATYYAAHDLERYLDNAEHAE